MSYFRCLGDDSSGGGSEIAALDAKIDRLLEEERRGNQFRKAALALTGVGLLVSIVRLGDVLRQMRKERRGR